MAYDPRSGNTPDAPKKAPTSRPVVGFKPTVKYPKPAATPAGPVAPTTPATPGQFRKAEEASNVGAPAYTPTPLTASGEFSTRQTASTTPTDATSPLLNRKYTAPDGTTFDDPTAYASYMNYLAGKEDTFNAAKRQSQSAYDLLYAEFSQYGLGSLIEPLRNLVQEGVTGPEFTLRLRQTEAYKKRFAANAQRIAKGLTALDEATYLQKEDAYQNIMRNYGLPTSYYTKDSLGVQAGFEQLLANDVSAAELEDRILTAKDKVLNANPEVMQVLKTYYPGITNGDILAYTLDPKNALKDIQRKVAAAEIGGAALAAGLTSGVTRAEELAGYGITKAQAQEGFQSVAQMLPRGSQLADIYKQQPYTQAVAEAEVFGTQGAANAAERRKRLKELEQASFGGQSGVGALDRDRALYGQAYGQLGQY